MALRGSPLAAPIDRSDQGIDGATTQTTTANLRSGGYREETLGDSEVGTGSELLSPKPHASTPQQDMDWSASTSSNPSLRIAFKTPSSSASDMPASSLSQSSRLDPFPDGLSEVSFSEQFSSTGRDGTRWNLSRGITTDVTDMWTPALQLCDLARTRVDPPSEGSYISSPAQESIATEKSLFVCPPHLTRYYLSHWEEKLLPRLPSALTEAYHHFGTTNLFQETAIAIAAADLATCPPSKPPPNTNSNQHNVASVCMYNRGLAQFSLHIHSGSRDSYVWNLSLILLFACYEIGWGTIAGAVVHLREADDLIVGGGLGPLRGSTVGSKLICAWMSIRSQIAADCAPSSLQSFALFLRSNPAEVALNEVNMKFGSPGERLAPILGEASFFARLIRVARLIGFENGTTARRTFTRGLKVIGATSLISHTPIRMLQPEMLAILASLRQRLDAWHDSLTPINLPYETFTSTSLDIDPSPTPDFCVKPLYFHSNASALEYLRYCLAQCHCCIKNLDMCTKPSAPDDRNSESWVTLSLRILAGLGHDGSASLDTFLTGIPWILSTMSLLTRTSRVITFMESWISRTDWIKNANPTKYMSTLLAGKMLLVMRKYLQRGRKISLLFTNINGNTERRPVHTGLTEIKAVLVGFDINSGEQFTDVLNIADMDDGISD